mmetsp:Transcript_17396/g.52127  ORF Transcript_17396/g.52127 Transcript_17396/m.52127 type:complete len:216 (+) Transcript_17396:3978-4625(+)
MCREISVSACFRGDDLWGCACCALPLMGPISMETEAKRLSFVSAASSSGVQDAMAPPVPSRHLRSASRCPLVGRLRPPLLLLLPPPPQPPPPLPLSLPLSLLLLPSPPPAPARGASDVASRDPGRELCCSRAACSGRAAAATEVRAAAAAGIASGGMVAAVMATAVAAALASPADASPALHPSVVLPLLEGLLCSPGGFEADAHPRDCASSSLKG